MSEQGSPPPSYDPPPPYGGQPPQTPPQGPTPPGYGYGGPLQPGGGAQPESYLVWSILTTIFCCLPLGVVSIVFAAQVSSKWQMGDLAGAQESSRKAKLWAIWSAVIGVVVILGVVALWIVLVVLAINNGGEYERSYSYP